MFGPDRVYAFDIETDTTVNGLDPAVAAVTEIAVSTIDRDDVFAGPDERAVLTAFARRLGRLPAGVLASWNGTFFDIPFIDARARRLGIDLGMQVSSTPGLTPKYDYLPGHTIGWTATWPAHPGGGHGRHTHVDIMWAYRSVARDLDVSWSLKPVATALGIPMITVDRERMHELDADRRRAYACSDTRGTRALALRALLGIEPGRADGTR